MHREVSGGATEEQGTVPEGHIEEIMVQEATKENF